MTLSSTKLDCYSVGYDGLQLQGVRLRADWDRKDFHHGGLGDEERGMHHLGIGSDVRYLARAGGHLEYSVRVSFLELYNEEIFDLISAQDATNKGSVILQVGFCKDCV